MLIRPAEWEDAQEILRWRNDSQTRAMSRNDALIDEQAHVAWFERVLENQDRMLLLGIMLDRPIGMVRFDRQVETLNWMVSVALAPEEQGKGFGGLLMTLALSQFFATHPGATLTAEIKQDHVPSRRLFESIGFLHKSNSGEMLNYFLSGK